MSKSLRTPQDGQELVPQPAAPASARPSPGRKLKLIGRESLASAIDAAVETTLGRLDHGLPGLKLVALQRGLRAELQVSLGRHGKQVRGMTRSQFLLELDRARDATLLARDRAREELIEMQTELDRARELAARSSPVAAQPAWELSELDEALTRLFTDAREKQPSMGELETGVRELMQEHAEAELSRLLAERTADYREQVDRFERRIRKLTSSLEQTERALAEVARLKSLDPGIASIYRTVQGLSPDDGMAKRKADMLSKIFEANCELQAG